MYAYARLFSFFPKATKEAIRRFSNSMSNLRIEWISNTFPLANRVIFRQLPIILGVPALFLFLFMAIITEENRWLVALQVAGIVVAFLVVLLALATLIVWLVGYQQHFVLDQKGVRSKLHGRTKIFLRTVQVVLLLSGRPGPMGSALLTRTRDAIDWEEVQRVEAEPRQHLLVLHRESGPPFYLFCTPEHFATVSEIVQAQTGLRW